LFAWGIALTAECLHGMKTLNRSVLYKTAAMVAVFVATAGWAWLLYAVAKWLALNLRLS
jgi:hypothetical protein